MNNQFALADRAVQMFSRVLMLRRYFLGHALEVVRDRRSAAKEYADRSVLSWRRARFVRLRDGLREYLLPVGTAGVEIIVRILFNQQVRFGLTTILGHRSDQGLLVVTFVFGFLS